MDFNTKFIPPSESESTIGTRWWLSPQGKFYHTMNHELWANNYLTKDVRLPQERINKLNKTGTVYTILENDGWVRVSIGPYKNTELAIEFIYKKGYTVPNGLIRLIRDLGIDKKSSYIIDLNTMRVGTLNEILKKSNSKQLITETISINQLIEYYKDRAKELQHRYGHGDSAVGEFQFEFYHKNLSVMCDVVHTDTILNSSKKVGPDTYVIPYSSTNKIPFNIDNFDIGNYVRDVVRALDKVGIKADMGMVSKNKFILLRKTLPGYVSVNSYTGDTLTVQLDVKNIEMLLSSSNVELVTKTIDVFIVKMFEVIKILETEIFPPNSNIDEVIKEGFGNPTPQQLIPDNEEELWKIIQSLPENHALQFSMFQPVPEGLLIILHGQGDIWAATYLNNDIGNPDGKWHKATEIILRHLTTQIYEFGEYMDVYYSIVKATPDIKETMFPKDFNRHRLATCMSAAMIATEYLLDKGITDFKIVEGFVAFDEETPSSDWEPHTWLEIKGRKFDPTKNQWKHLGYDPSKVIYQKPRREFTPEQYLKLCKIQHSKPLLEVRKGNDVTRWWIDTKGKFINVSRLGHYEWGRRFIKKIYGDNHPYTKDALKHYDFPYDFLYKMGWVRATFDGRLFAYTYGDVRPSSIIIQSIKEKAKKLGVNAIVDETGGGFTRIEEIRLEPPVDITIHDIKENMTYDELLKLTANTPRSPEDNTNRIDRSKNVNVRSIPVSIEEGREQWNFRYKSSPTATTTDKPFEGHITFLKGEVGPDDDAIKLECKVDCSCPDYMYRFAYNNYNQGAGDIGGDSLNRCINRSPSPSYNLGEGLCKHLSALSRFLETKISSTRRSNLFEAIGDIAKRGPFNITYYD